MICLSTLHLIPVVLLTTCAYGVRVPVAWCVHSVPADVTHRAYWVVLLASTDVSVRFNVDTVFVSQWPGASILLLQM